MSENSRGPVAPKDPTKKRDFFYIMKDKEIFGAPQPDGTYAHFLYMDMGRLTDAASLIRISENEKNIAENVKKKKA